MGGPLSISDNQPPAITINRLHHTRPYLPYLPYHTLPLSNLTKTASSSAIITSRLSTPSIANYNAAPPPPQTLALALPLPLLPPPNRQAPFLPPSSLHKSAPHLSPPRTTLSLSNSHKRSSRVITSPHAVPHARLRPPGDRRAWSTRGWASRPGTTRARSRGDGQKRTRARDGGLIDRNVRAAQSNTTPKRPSARSTAI